MKRDKETIIGNRIKELRLEKKWSVAKLAEYTGLSASAISNYEYGFRKPDASALVAFERIFGVSGDYLLGNTEEPASMFVWDDPELNEEIRSNFPVLIRNIAKRISNSSAKSQKMAFDICVELLHTLNMENDGQKESTLSLLQIAFSSATRFADVCNATNNAELDRVENAGKVAIATYSDAISAYQNSPLK